MLYRIHHVTRFEYAAPVASSYQVLHLSPRAFDRQQVLSASIEIQPKPESTQQRVDYFGNTVTDVVIGSRHDKLEVVSNAQVDVNVDETILLDLSPPWEQVAAAVNTPESDDARDAARFCFPSPQITLDGVRDYAAASFAPGTPFLRAAQDLTTRIFTDFEYEGGVTDVYTPVPRALAARKGVCQDFAHVAIAGLRAFGLPARYVSGYLLTHPPEGQPRLTGADASHAWFSVWCPEFGWVDFDPTNNLRPQNEHITIGWGRDYNDVSPTRGFIHGGGSQTLKVAVDVLPL